MRDSHMWEFCHAAHESLIFDSCKGGMRPVERSSERDIAWVNSRPKSSSVTLWFSVIWLSCKWAGFLCFALCGRINVQGAVAMKWLMAAKMRMLVLSVRLWLARHDVLNNVCQTDFPQKLFEIRNQPWYIQWHQDHSCWCESQPVWPGYTSSVNHSVEYMQLMPVGFMSMIGK